ncbi:FxsA family protein [Magnetospirillum molischianum]|uniref:FxsA cytoplasmic membrane protein n=1 Tax=Magnetospirillum molischianum DSM 120 TaxID=1150626 RepID=H8FN34_MAGML|nr:FxsA family protein [Magnetospirillum molischianum]CCG39772.1 FxsA cytoplasmic membrane protein [Magnetospirillum molischianum DSM 120]
MGWMLFAGVIALPVAEIMVWVKMSAVIGAGATILLSVLAVLIGLSILRRQGLAVLFDARSRLEQGEMPVEAAFDGLCLSAAGFLLVLPGFLTDILAVALLLAPVRAALWIWIERNSSVVVSQTGTGPGRGAGPRSGPVIIEGDFHEVDPKAPPVDRRVDPQG